MSGDLVKVPREKLNELISVVRSINRGRQHEIRVGGDDDPCYWQRKEWVDWALEVAEDLDSVVAQINDEPTKATGSTAASIAHLIWPVLARLNRQSTDQEKDQ